MNYISLDRKRLIGRNNNILKQPLCLEYDIEETLDFQIVNANNQIVEISELSGLHLAVGLKLGQPSYNLLALSDDYTISDNTIHFKLNTYTINWLNQVRKPSTEAYIELSQMSLNAKKVWLRDNCYVWPRCWVDGLAPQEIESNDYYNKTEVNELVDGAVSTANAYTDEQIAHIELSGYATEADLQIVSGAITENAEAISEIAATVSDVSGSLQELSGDVGTLENDIINKADKAVVEIISGNLDAVSGNVGDIGQLLDGVAQNLATLSSDFEEADTVLTGHVADTEIHTTALEKAAWTAKQNAITAEAKLDYGLLSGTPTIPTKTSDLTNDSGFATSGYVDAQVSGKQNAITAEAKLDYALLSGTPTIPLSTSQLTNDSGYQTATDVENAISGKQNAITAENKLAYSLLSGVPDTNPAYIPVDVKTATVDCEYVLDFIGAKIQKYDAASATGGSNSLEIFFDNLASISSGCAPTFELQIPVTDADVTTVTLPAGTQIVEMPDALASTSGKIAYHDIVFRAEEDVNGETVVYASYAYKFDEEENAGE